MLLKTVAKQRWEKVNGCSQFVPRNAAQLAWTKGAVDAVAAMPYRGSTLGSKQGIPAKLCDAFAIKNGR